MEESWLYNFGGNEIQAIKISALLGKLGVSMKNFAIDQ
jgi:hypothetical protein